MEIRRQYVAAEWLKLGRPRFESVHVTLHFLDPDQAEDYQLRKWLADHPEKREITGDEREKMARRLAAALG